MVYIIRAGRFIKVGTSEQPVQRLYELQSANPERIELLFTLPGGRKEEAQIHKQLRTYHVRGEWFADCLGTWKVLRTLISPAGLRAYQRRGFGFAVGTGGGTVMTSDAPKQPFDDSGTCKNAQDS